MAILSWSSKRQLIYILSTVFVVILVTAYPIFKAVYTPPSCIDQKQNQGEVGVDCGGPCDMLCPNQVKDLSVTWVKLFKIGDDLYDIAAHVENPNTRSGTERFKYTFEVLSASGEVLATRTGTTYIDPREAIVLFDSKLRFGAKVPASVTLEIDKNNIVWKEIDRKEIPVAIKNKRFVNLTTEPRLTGTIENTSIKELKDVDLTALIHNEHGDIIAVSKTSIPYLEGEASKDAVFTWPLPFTEIPVGGICASPADMMLVFDRSGSMDDDGMSPPQPLTAAKEAALTFVEKTQTLDQVGLVSFATTASDPIDHILTTDHAAVETALSGVVIGTNGTQHTNLGDAIEKATGELLSSRHRENMKRAIIVLTDGIASRPLNPDDESDETYPETYAAEKANDARVQDIAVYVIGLGNEVNETFLKDDLASSPEKYYKAATVKDLESIYEQVATAVCKQETFLSDILVRVR